MEEGHGGDAGCDAVAVTAGRPQIRAHKVREKLAKLAHGLYQLLPFERQRLHRTTS